MSPSYRTVSAAVRFEGDKIKGSRFIADVVPVGSVEQARERIDALRAEFPDANHHCWAYRLGEQGTDFRYSDDGEPSGSAGRPILQQIDGAGLTQVLVVVTRYFGGTRLGVGGLVRAYGGAAADALAQGDVQTVVMTRSITVTYAYDDSTAVDRQLRVLDLAPVEVDYGERVRVRLDVPLDQVAELRERLRDATAGRVMLPPDDGPSGP